MPVGTVVYSSRAPIGYCVIAANPISTNQGFKSLVLHKGIVPEFIRYYLLSSKEYAELLASGTTFKELSGARMATLLVPLAPEKEQRRIVARLDKLLGYSKEARDQLDRIPKLVERYKNAVLAAAFRGDLTAAWRVTNNSPIQEAWRTETLGDLALDIRYGTAAKCHYAPEATPVLRIPNVAAGRIDTTDLKYGAFESREIVKLALKQGDLLVIRSNGSLELVGRVAVVDAPAVGYLFAGYLIRLRLDETKVLPSFVAFGFEEPAIRSTVEGFAKSTSGVNNINSEQLRSLEIPLPPLAEQHEIVRHVRERFLQIDTMLNEATRAKALLDRLNLATLAKAFRGELTPPGPIEQSKPNVTGETPKEAPKSRRHQRVSA
jgi:type I restriction enzyme S subunit